LDLAKCALSKGYLSREVMKIFVWNVHVPKLFIPVTTGLDLDNRRNSILRKRYVCLQLSELNICIETKKRLLTIPAGGALKIFD
jgi:hypothetical protein